MVRAPIKRQGGSIVLAIAIVLVVVGLALLTSHLTRSQSSLLKQSTAPATVLTRLDSALSAFVSQHKRLPCPARGNLASGAPGAGTESINMGTGQCNPTNQADGVVPWITLGLTEADALDPWAGRVSYRVQPSLASNLLLLMNMSWCDPASAPSGAWAASLDCNAPCTTATCRHPLNYLYGKGLAVQDGSGAWLNQPNPAWAGMPTPPPPASNGAAYVLVSHGANGAGAYNANGVLQPGRSAPGTSETANLNGQALTGATVFINTAASNTAGTGYFDDTLSHPALATVLARASLGPRTPH